MANPVLTKQHLATWGVADAANQTDYSAKPTLKPYHFWIWTPAMIQQIFGV